MPSAFVGGSLTKIGTGTLILSGVNTYTGGTNINGGVLAIFNDHNLGAAGGPLSFNDGTLQTLAGIVSNRAITLNLGGGSFDSNGFDSTLNGVISGPGALTKIGAGTLTLTSANTYTGGTNINGGVLAIFNHNNLGAPGGQLSFSDGTLQTLAEIESNRAIMLNAGGGTFDSNGFDSTLHGVISGSGAFTKLGLGDLTLTAASTYTGNTNINRGVLFVDGSLASANVIVNVNGTLAGNGTLFGNVLNSGVVSPGHSAGKLNFGGNYVQTPNGTLVIEVASATSFDRVLVGGSAILSGSLQVVRLSGYNPQVGDRLEFLTAGGAVLGKFTAINNDFAALNRLVRLEVVYNDTDVALVARQNSFANALGIENGANIFGLTPNQIAVARALDSALFDPRQREVLSFLNNADFRTLPSLLDQIAPEELTALYTIGFAQMDALVLGLQQRFADLRLSANTSGEGDADTSGKNPKGAREVVPEVETTYEDRWGFFINANGDLASVGDTFNATGYDIRSGGTTLGIDYRLSSEFTLGLTLRYARTDVDLIADGDVEVDGGRAGLYAQYYSEGFFTEGLVGGGYNSYDTERSGLGARAHGSTEGAEFDAYLGVGYDAKVGQLTVTPVASLLYSLVGIDGFDERGSLQPLHIEDQSEDSLRSRIGLRASFTTQCGEAKVTPYVSAQWQHEFLEDELPLESRFANGAGGIFTVHGPKVGRDSALLSAGLTVQWKHYAFYASYQADVGRENYENQTALIGLRVSW